MDFQGALAYGIYFDFKVETANFEEIEVYAEENNLDFFFDGGYDDPCGVIIYPPELYFEAYNGGTVDVDVDVITAPKEKYDQALAAFCQTFALKGSKEDLTPKWRLSSSES